MKKIKFLTNDTKPVFPSAENEQLEKLAESDVLRIYRENIKEIAKNPFCPRYHLVAPAGYLHDPNGLCFWRGKWHLFYQHVYGEDSAEGLSGSSICWGHAVSDDLIRWKDLPDAIYPGPDISCWSGATLVEEDRVIAAYYGLYSGIVVAVSSDPLLLNWEKYGTVIPERDEKGNPAKFPIYDPCIFKEGKYYYILSGGAEYDEKTKHNHRQTYLLRSEDLRNWEYRHPFIENDCYGGVGDDGSCPYFVDIGEKGRERKLYVHFSHISGSAYAVGDFDAKREKFTVLGGGKFSCGHWSGGGLHAPSCSPDGKGGAVVIFNMNAPAEGAFPIMSLPQTMKLAGPGNNEIYLDVAEGVRSLRGRHVSSDPRIIRAGQTFSPDGFSGNCAEIRLEAKIPYQRALALDVLRTPDGEEFARITVFRNGGITNPDLKDPEVLESGQYTVVTADASRVGGKNNPSLSVRPPEISLVPVKDGESVVLDVFIDKCVLEVFVNGKRSLIQSVYPSRDARGVCLSSIRGDAEILSLDMWEMKSYGEK